MSEIPDCIVEIGVGLLVADLIIIKKIANYLGNIPYICLFSILNSRTTRKNITYLSDAELPQFLYS